MLKNIAEFGLEWGAYREPGSSISCLLLSCQRAVVVLKNARLRQSLPVHEMPATAIVQVINPRVRFASLGAALGTPTPNSRCCVVVDALSSRCPPIQNVAMLQTIERGHAFKNVA